MLHTNRKAALWSLVVVMGALLCFLVFAEKPWDHSEKIAERIAAGKSPSLKQEILVGLYQAASVNLALCTLLLASLKLWTRPMEEKSGSASRSLRSGGGDLDPGVTKAFLLLVALAVFLGGALRWNLASKSLWWDELWNAKQTYHGSFKTGEDGTKNFQSHSFQRALWYYKKPTNHVPFAVSARLSLKGWQFVTGRSPAEFNEFVLRLPSFLASLGAIAGIAILLRIWGMGRAGILAAFLFAIHPWHNPLWDRWQKLQSGHFSLRFSPAQRSPLLCSVEPGDTGWHLDSASFYSSGAILCLPFSPPPSPW